MGALIPGLIVLLVVQGLAWAGLSLMFHKVGYRGYAQICFLFAFLDFLSYVMLWRVG